MLVSTVKTAFVRDLELPSSAILAWLREGETVVLVENGEPLAGIVPEKSVPTNPLAARRELFARRFAPLAVVPNRDLSDVVNENRGEA